MKIVFLGTPYFVIPVLEKLNQQHEVVGVFCQPDKLGNRNKMEISPVKTYALNHGIAVYQPNKIDDDIIATISKMDVDLMVVSAYGKILPQRFLDIAPIINIHPSFLPKYRGSAPVQWALVQGEKEIGITIMKLCYEMDAGDILLQDSIQVSKEDNAQTIIERSFIIGANLLSQVLSNLDHYLCNAKKQNEKEATIFPMIKKEDGKINFCQTAEAIVNMVKGFYIWPNAFCALNGKKLKIFDAEVADFEGEHRIGEVVNCNKLGITVRCHNSCILLKEVQIENGKRMEANAFVNGNQIKVGDILC